MRGWTSQQTIEKLERGEGFSDMSVIGITFDELKLAGHSKTLSELLRNLKELDVTEFGSGWALGDAKRRMAGI
jgi:hypothetical protein